MACVDMAAQGGANYGAPGKNDGRIEEILAALPSLPNAALDLIVQTVRAFRR
jgi:hypothetical protein